MKRLWVLLALVLAFWALPSSAQIYSITITGTNLPTGPQQTLTVNGSTRSFTNNVSSSPGTLIMVTNTIANSVTQLLNHLTLYPFSTGHRLKQTSPTNVIIICSIGEIPSAAGAGGWADVTVTSNVFLTPVWGVRVPMSVETATNWTSIASLVVLGLERSTQAMSAGSVTLSNVMNLYSNQFVAGNKTFAGTNQMTNALLSAPILLSPISSGLVNTGAAIRSQGPGGNSFQMGSNALALGANSIAIGNNALATNTSAMAIGISAIASNQSATAVGNGAQALTNNATAVGQGAVASGNGAFAGGLARAIANSAIAIGTEDTLASADSAIAIGPVATATQPNGIAIGQAAANNFSNSVALGRSATTTSTNQVMLGTSAETVVAPGNLQAGGLVTFSGSQSNTTFTGTNVLNGRLALKSRLNSSLANGNNSGVILGTNVFVVLSGATTVAALCGFAAEEDGSWHRVMFTGAITNLIANQSGNDPVAANRIVTGTGADVAFTNSPTVLDFIYYAANSRWYLQLPR